MDKLKIELGLRGFSNKDIESHPALLSIMDDYLKAYESRDHTWKKSAESNKLRLRLMAQIEIPKIKAKVAKLDDAYLRIKLKMQGFRQGHIDLFPELVELQRQRILDDLLSKNADKGAR